MTQLPVIKQILFDSPINIDVLFSLLDVKSSWTSQIMVAVVAQNLFVPIAGITMYFFERLII